MLRRLAITASLALALILAGCGGSGPHAPAGVGDGTAPNVLDVPPPPAF